MSLLSEKGQLNEQGLLNEKSQLEAKALLDRVSLTDSRVSPDTESMADAAGSTLWRQGEVLLPVNDHRVIRQCLEALLFEGVIGYRELPGELECELDGQLVRLPGRVGAFGRVRLSMACDWAQVVPDLYGVLRAAITDKGRVAQLYRELGQTQMLWQQACDSAPQAAESSRRALPYRALEQALIEGHPYHPCFKVRAGFSVTDNRLFGPEYGTDIDLHWVAVRRDLYRACLPDDEARFWRDELGEQDFHRLLQRLSGLNYSLADYGLLPVHPWQWQQLRGTVLRLPLATAELIDLGVCGRYRATASIRTLWNAEQPALSNIKLPLDIVVTSSRRNLPPETMLAAPALSGWLQQLLDADPFLQRYLGIQHEHAGICLASESDQPLTSAWLSACSHKMSALFRRSIEGQLHAGERVVPFAALLAIESDGSPWLDPLLRQHGIGCWLDRLIEVVVIPLWHLLVHHGIALEAHAQNLVLVLRDGLPCRLIAKDFHESLEYVPGFLAQPALCPNFGAIHPHLRRASVNDSYWMSDTEALRELFVDTVFIYTLADLSWLLECHYGYPESDFWERVGRWLAAYRRSGITAAERLDRLDLFTSHVSTESLLTRKLRPGVTACRHSTTNPLAANC